jgi:AcrR family transcriptional regulator
MKRKYELKERAKRQAETRRRIVEAAVELHTSVGPARTTVSAIADRAGVQRHTVYAHFPDERALFEACSTHWRAAHPFPDAAVWETAESAEEQLRAALTAIYGWYELVEDDLAILVRDRSVSVLTDELQSARTRALEGVGETLARAWPRRKSVRAAIGHALEFETWRSLARHGLTRREAVESMLGLVESASRA